MPSRYILQPLGSTSRIEKLTDQNGAKGQIMDLFSSGDSAIGRLFMHRKFDVGMVSLLECLKQLGDHCENLDSSIRIPYQ